MTATPPLTDEQHAAIRSRRHLATGGTWYLQPKHGPNFVAAEHHGYEHGIGDLAFGDGDQADADREFVLNAHDDVTALLVELDRYAALDLGDPDGRVSATCDSGEHPTWLRQLDDTRGCPWCEVDRLRAERDQARAELTQRRTEDLTLRGILAPADGPHPVPMPLGDSLAPAVEWLITQLATARAQLAAVLALPDIGHEALELMDPEQYHQAIGYNDGLAASTQAINDIAVGES